MPDGLVFSTDGRSAPGRRACAVSLVRSYIHSQALAPTPSSAIIPSDQIPTLGCACDTPEHADHALKHEEDRLVDLPALHRTEVPVNTIGDSAFALGGPLTSPSTGQPKPSPEPLVRRDRFIWISRGRAGRSSSGERRIHPATGAMARIGSRG